MAQNYRIENDTCTFSEGAKLIRRISFKKAFSKIVFPSSLRYICPEALSYSSIKSVYLPYGLKTIGDGAFRGAELEEVTIPGTVKKIGKGAFDLCKQLKTIIINRGVKEIGKDAFGDCRVEEIKIPNTVTTIRQSAFYGCRNLKSVELPSSTVIMPGAFYNTGIEHIYLCDSPSSYQCLVKAFNKGAFSHATQTSEVLSLVSGKNVTIYNRITLHVPKAMVQEYKNNPFFRRFNIVENDNIG